MIQQLNLQVSIQRTPNYSCTDRCTSISMAITLYNDQGMSITKCLRTDKWLHMKSEIFLSYEDTRKLAFLLQHG